ncbi:MAG: iron ABC transporter permease [Thermaceae bacterium]|nr:iron ABC transporter permease [Thermaceae bacterium]
MARASTLHRRPAPMGAGRLLARVALGSTGLAAILLLLVYPLVSFLLLAVFPGLFGQSGQGFSLAAFAQALDGYALQSVLNSLAIGLSSGALAVGLGLYVSWLTQRTTLSVRRLVDGAVWLLLLTPSYLLAIGWLVLTQHGGLLNQAGLHWGWLEAAFSGPIGVALVLAVKHIPFAYLAIAPSWNTIGGELEEAAQVHGIRGGQATLLLAKLLLPAIAAAFAVVFAEALSDFGVAATLGASSNVPLLTYSIYRALYANPLNFPLAAASSWILLALAGIAVWAQARVNRRAAAYAVLSGRGRLARRVVLGGYGKAVAWFSLGLLGLVALAIPALATVFMSFTKVLGDGLNWANLGLDNYQTVLRQGDLLGPLTYSGMLAGLAATTALVLALVLASVLSSGSRLARGLDVVLLGTLALPGLVLAAGYIFAYNQPFLPLYGTSLLLGMAYAAGAMPSSSRILLGPLTQLHHSLGEAARVHGVSGLGVLRRITLPLLAQPLLYAWLLAASGIVFELPASELLYPPGQPPLAVALLKSVHNFDFGLSTALEVVAVAIVVGTVWLIRAVVTRLLPPNWQRRLNEQHSH